MNSPSTPHATAARARYGTLRPVAAGRRARAARSLHRVRRVEHRAVAGSPRIVGKPAKSTTSPCGSRSSRRVRSAECCRCRSRCGSSFTMFDGVFGREELAFLDVHGFASRAPPRAIGRSAGRETPESAGMSTDIASRAWPALRYGYVRQHRQRRSSVAHRLDRISRPSSMRDTAESCRSRCGSPCRRNS